MQGDRFALKLPMPGQLRCHDEPHKYACRGQDLDDMNGLGEVVKQTIWIRVPVAGMRQGKGGRTYTHDR